MLEDRNTFSELLLVEWSCSDDDFYGLLGHCVLYIEFRIFRFVKEFIN